MINHLPMLSIAEFSEVHEIEATKTTKTANPLIDEELTVLFVFSD
jgi:hypothetical protein